MPSFRDTEPAVTEATLTGSAPLASAAGATGQMFNGLDDPALIEFLRAGNVTGAGALVNSMSALRNMAVLRCVRLICETIAMLPLNILEDNEARAKVTDIPLAKVLRVKPNGFQTPYEFKRLMMIRLLTKGKAYARIVKGVGNQVIALLPLDPDRIEEKLRDDWTVEYTYTRPDGGRVTLQDEDVFALRGLSLDGIGGISLVKLASEAIGLAMRAEEAAARLFKNGMMVGGALSHPEKLSDDAHRRLKESLENRYVGAENAHKWMVLEEGMVANKFDHTAADSQHLENRNHQIEEVARAFGVPRPLLMMDDTSWGSGIEQLAIYFIQYTLAPYFTCWEQAIARSLFTDLQAQRYLAKFNERALMRGTLKDQAEFFAKALGSGGSQPWMAANEVRDLSDLPASKEAHAGKLAQPVTKTTKPDPKDEPAPTPA